MKEEKGKRGEWAGPDLHPQSGGGGEAGVRTSHRGNWGCWMKQLICDSLNRVRTTQTIHATALHSPDKNTSPPECMVAGSWSLVIKEQSHGEDCCWLWGHGPKGQEGGDQSVEYLWSKTRKQGNTAELGAEGEAITVASLPTCKCQQLTIRETAQRGWPFECLIRQTLDEDQSGRPFESPAAKGLKKILLIIVLYLLNLGRWYP